ncbi:hypothetical protein MHB65_17120 [Lysinibacillus sp. FSL K6-0075]|uniref:hypothetical protein n=1 Tax=Lysinibacillus sp. FSL K6-0075 TaxID=2921415 RepID=UPI003158EB98
MNESKSELILAVLGMLLLLIFSIVMLIEANVYMTALTVVGTIATTSAAIATYLSASAAKESANIASRALDNQIQESILNNKPEIISLNKYVELKFNNFNDKPHLCNWDTQDYDLQDRLFVKQVQLPIANVGKNFAKDIEIRWELNGFEESVAEMKNLKPTLKKFYTTLDFQIKEGQSFKGLRIFETFSNMENGFLSIDEFRIDNFEIEKIPFLKNGEEAFINIPTSYVIFYNILISIFHLEWRKVNKHPLLNLNIKYRDVDNRLYEDTFILGITKMQIGHSNFIYERNSKFDLNLIKRI